MENNINIEDIFKGILTGALVSYLIILGMRPAAIYPDNILDIIDNPWIFLILFIFNYYILYWDVTIGLLLFLTLIALILDIIIFTDGDFIKDNINILNTNLYSIDTKIEDYKTNTNTSSTTSSTSLTYDNKTYKDLNDIVLEKLINYTRMQEDKDTVKSSNSFL
jgi:hypothetical protein